MKEVKRTLEYYNRKASELIEKYDKADLYLPSNFLNFFDAIISIAVLMHIAKKI